MKKIQKCQMGATLALDLAPYSFSAPGVGNTISSAVPAVMSTVRSAVPATWNAISSTAPAAWNAISSIVPEVMSTVSSAASTAAPYLATAGQVALPLLAAPAAMGLGLYTLGNAKHGAVSGAMQAAIERERQRHLAEAEAEWQKKNQHYADLISTHGPIQYPVGTFYDYDSSTGTAYIERDLGNGLVGRWTQNMRTREQGNPVVYNSATGEVYEGIMNSPHSAYIPISLSNGKVVALPTDITDYRVFDESGGDGEGSGSGSGVGSGSGAGAGSGVGAGVGGGSPLRNDDDDKDNQISSVEEYVRKFGKNMDRRTARRIRNSERISHDANGNINRHATRLLNRGVKTGVEGTKSGGFPWQTFLFGTSVGGGLTLGGQTIFGNKEEVKDSELHGDVTYADRTKSLIDRAIEGETELIEQTESAPIQGDSIDWSKIDF